MHTEDERLKREKNIENETEVTRKETIAITWTFVQSSQVLNWLAATGRKERKGRFLKFWEVERGGV